MPSMMLFTSPEMNETSAAPAQTADEVAASIVGVVDQPVAEVFTNPALAGIARKYFEDVGAFEKGLR